MLLPPLLAPAAPQAALSKGAFGFLLDVEPFLVAGALSIAFTGSSESLWRAHCGFSRPACALWTASRYELSGIYAEWRSGLIWRCLLEGLGRRSRRVPLASEGGWLSSAVDYLDFDVFEGVRCVGQSAVCCEEAGLVETDRSSLDAECMAPALCGLMFKKLVVFLFLSGRLLRWVV
jgi:hypothetical protein